MMQCCRRENKQALLPVTVKVGILKRARKSSRRQGRQPWQPWQLARLAGLGPARGGIMNRGDGRGLAWRPVLALPSPTTSYVREEIRTALRNSTGREKSQGVKIFFTRVLYDNYR